MVLRRRVTGVWKVDARLGLCLLFIPGRAADSVPWFISDDVSRMAFLTMTLHQGGTARMYELTPDTQPSLLSTFSGDRRFSRFGGVLHFSDLDGDGLGGKGTGPLAQNRIPLLNRPVP